MKSATFVGIRQRGHTAIMVIESGGVTALHDYLREWSHHEAHPFDWGDVSLGSAYTACALLLVVSGSEAEARARSPLFLNEVVANMPLLSWEMSENEVAAWAINRQRKDRFQRERRGERYSLEDLITK